MDSHKKVDESWKEAVQKERSAVVGPAASTEHPASQEPAQEEGGDSEFLGFISTLAMQTLMALGEAPHPGSDERHEDLTQARYLIDVLQILSEKTKGNLTKQEASEMKNLLYQLKMKFVQKEKLLGGSPQ